MHQLIAIGLDYVFPTCNQQFVGLHWALVNTEHFSSLISFVMLSAWFDHLWKLSNIYICTVFIMVQLSVINCTYRI